MRKLQRAALAAASAAVVAAAGLGIASATASAQPAAASHASQSAAAAGQVGKVAANERVVERFLRTVIDEHHGSAAGGLLTANASWHGGTVGVVSGRANVQGLFTGIVTALPNLHGTTYDILGQGDQVVVRQILTGTQKEAILGIPASGKTVTWNALDLFVLRDGKISAIWAGDDWTAILADTGTYKAPWIK
jgi:predicted ester cyclase